MTLRQKNTRSMSFLAVAVGLLLPGIYIALATFHQAMIPLPLLLSIIESKQSVSRIFHLYH